MGAVKSIQPQERACLSGLFFRKGEAGASAKLQPTGRERRVVPSPALLLPCPRELGTEASLQSTEQGEKEQGRCGGPARTSDRSLCRAAHVRGTSETMFIV